MFSGQTSPKEKSQVKKKKGERKVSLEGKGWQSFANGVSMELSFSSYKKDQIDMKEIGKQRQQDSRVTSKV